METVTLTGKDAEDFLGEHYCKVCKRGMVSCGIGQASTSRVICYFCDNCGIRYQLHFDKKPRFCTSKPFDRCTVCACAYS